MPFVIMLISDQQRTAIHVQDTRMKYRMTKVLRFWVECECSDYRAQNLGLRKSELLGQILRRFEKAGDAMRYLDVDGRVAWKATPRMLTKLANAEQEAIDDLAEWP